MYREYYHLHSEPFSSHPSTGVFFISHTHKEAWYYLLFGIETKEPFMVLTGEYGMGKTLLCLRLMKLLKDKGVPRVEYISTPNEGYGGILRRMASSLGITLIPEEENVLQDMIYNRFRADVENSRFYLILDDAHELDTLTLTKLKHLSTFNHNEFFPIIMIFVGHPSFLQDLRTPALSSLNQRIKRRYHLARFNLDDTKNYIYYRLLNSGATGVPIFADDTIRKIYEYSGGVPRLINNICDTCMLIGASKKMISIAPYVVDEAQKIVEGTLSRGNGEDQGKAKAIETGQEAITFSEELPAGEMDEGLVYVSPADKAEADLSRSPAAVSRTGFGRTAKWAVTLIVVLLIGAFLFRQLREQEWFSGLFAPQVKEKKEEINLEPGPLPLKDRSSVEVPVLREEERERPGQKPPAQMAQPETPPPAAHPQRPPEPLPQQAPKGEPAPLPGGEEKAFHPFSLRVANYQQRELALKEMAELRQRGLIPYLVKADLGDLGVMWRILVGFYRTEEEAARVKSSYKLSQATVLKTEYACFLGDYESEGEMIKAFEGLRQTGYMPYVIQKDRNRFRLFSGGYEKKAEAEAHRLELQKSGVSCQVVRR